MLGQAKAGLAARSARHTFFRRVPVERMAWLIQVNCHGSTVAYDLRMLLGQESIAETLSYSMA